MPAVYGDSDDWYAVVGQCTNGYGVLGQSTKAVGVVGETASPVAAMWGHNTGLGPGVLGSSDYGTNGVLGLSWQGTGVYGRSVNSGPGVIGESSVRPQDVVGGHKNAAGVRGTNNTANAVGVYGEAPAGFGVFATGETALEADATPGIMGALAGFFRGNVSVHGELRKFGGGFRVDHPRDPANKYLNHSFVESDEMKNVYDGIVTLDGNGTASVDLPEWFEALNEDFRYQLTAVGQAAPNLHVAEEIYENRFKIGGGEEGMKVCWQLTGSRKDPWAAANPFEVEEGKPQEERGLYLEPSLYGAPEEQRVTRARIGEMREPPQPPQPPQIEPPGAPPMPPYFAAPGFDVVRLLQQLDELRRQVKKLRRRWKR
jgi:hypothetical protein